VIGLTSRDVENRPFSNLPGGSMQDVSTKSRSFELV
jgi:hypothetical protein